MADPRRTGSLLPSVVKWLRHEAPSRANVVLVAVVGGLFCWVALSMFALHECVHALGHSDHQYSILAKLLDDGTPLPGAVAVLVGVTYLVAVATEKWRRRDTNTKGFTFLGILPLFFAACSLGIACLTFAIWLLDIRPTNLRGVGPSNPFGMVLLTSVALNVACAVVAIVVRVTKRPSAALVLIVLPLAASPVLAFSGPARTLASLYPNALPSVFPTPIKILALTAVVGSISAAPIHLAWRSAPGTVSRAVLVFPGVLGSSVIFAIVCIGIILPFHHMCMIYRHGSVQWAGTAVVSLAFVALWTIISVVQWRRSRRVREHGNG